MDVDTVWTRVSVAKSAWAKPVEPPGTESPCVSGEAPGPASGAVSDGCGVSVDIDTSDALGGGRGGEAEVTGPARGDELDHLAVRDVGALDVRGDAPQEEGG